MFNKIPPNINDENYINKVFEIYLLLFIQYANGDLSREDTHTAIIAYLKHNKGIVAYKNMRKENDKTSLDFYLPEQIPINQCWEDIIFDGKIIAKVINDSIESDFIKATPGSQSTLFYLLNHWRNMSTDEFKDKVFLLRKEFSNGLYIHPGEILHIANILIIFSKYGIVPWSIDSLTKYVTVTINKLKRNLKILPSHQSTISSYAGWGYSYECPELVKLREKLLKINATNLQRNLKNNIDICIQNLESKFDEFIKDIILVNGTGKYRDMPIFSWINIKQLYNKLIILDQTKQYLFIDALEERYEMKYSNGTYKKVYHDDFKNICTLRDTYTKHVKRSKKLYNPQIVQLEEITGSYDKLIEYMRSFIEKDN